MLTLTPFYPVAEDDARGCFVAESLPSLEEQGVVSTVMAVQPFYRGRARASIAAPQASWVHYFALPGRLGLPAAGALLFASLLSKARRLHRTRAVDLIHAHAPLPCGHAAALLSRELGIPHVVTVHGLDAYSTNQAGGYSGQWSKHVSQWVYRSARRVICISEKVREQVLEGAATAVNTAVVYNGVDPQTFSPASEPDSPPSILSVGNLIPIKGHMSLLQAMALLRNRYPDLRCEIIGDGPERARLNALVAELNLRDNIRFLGRQNRRQVADAMRRCTLFALPSRYEGLGCVYLEAMSAEKPVIACRGQGIEEVIQHGINGWLVGTDDAQGLSEAISLLLQSGEVRQQLGRAARLTVLRGFTLVHQAEGLARIYRECLA